MEVIKTAKTVEEAIKEALLEFGIEKENAEVEVLEEGSKGFLGLGSKDAIVKVTVKNTPPEDLARDFLSNIFEKMGMDVGIDIKMDGENMNIDLSGENMGILIGRRGETLSSIQYLTSLAVNKKTKDYCRVLIDTENYKKKRENTLINLANKLAGNAVKYRRNITLEPMNPYERRIIHSTLQDKEMVSTYSTGEEPNRKVVIAYNKGYKK